MTFVHLHTHSHYSLAKGIASPAALVRAAAQRGMPALALTDQNTLAGMAEHLRACEDMNVRPILGAEIAIQYPAGDGGAPIHHLTVLIENETGYRSLVRLLNAARRCAAGAGQPALPFADFAGGAKGLLILTGCQKSKLFGAAMEKEIEAAFSHIQALRRAVGRDRIFIEIQPAADAASEAANRRLLELADYAELPALATQNVLYIEKGDHLAAFVLARMGQDRISQAEWGQWMGSRAPRHFADAAEMRAHFGWRPDLLDNTLVAAERCRFRSPSIAQHFPVQILSCGEETEAALWERVVAGVPRGCSPEAQGRFKEALDREIGAIRNSGLAPYFLMLSELAAEIDRAGIVRGPARGAWQSSVAAHALGLTPLDPVAFHLPEPDWLGRGERLPLYRFELAEEDVARVHRLFAERVGQRRMARVGRYSLQRRPALLRWLVKSVAASEAKLARLLGERAASPKRAKKAGKSGNGNGHSDEEGLQIDDSAFLRRAADLLSDRPRRLRPDGHMATFSGLDMEDATVLEDLPAEGGLTTELDGAALDWLGLPRVALAGRPLMSVLALALRYIHEQSDPALGLESIPLDDGETFALLGAGLTNGIDELHLISTKALLRASPPTSLLDLAGLLQKRKGGPEASEAGSSDLSASLATALLGYWAAWLKRRHPLAFMAALLSRSAGNPRRLAILLRETKRMRIAVLPPHLNLSRYEFAPEKKAVRAGLAVVGQLGERAYAELERERRGRPFDDLVDLCRRADPRILNHRIISNLIKAGALDWTGIKRSHQLAQLDQIFIDVKAERDEALPAGQLTLFDLESLERKRPGSEVRLDDVPELSADQLLALEREAVGYTLSADPFDSCLGLIARMKACGPFDLRKRDVGGAVFLAGYIDHVEREGFPTGPEAAAALDCEGLVVRVPRGARSFIGQALECEGPALLGGVVKRQGQEVYLEAHTIYSLEEAARLAQQVRRITLNLAGEDKRTLRWIGSLLKSYPGETEVVLAGGPETPVPGSEKLHGLTTLFCPPVYLGLTQYLLPDRVALEDGEGRPVRIDAPEVVR